jgi:hypothetical protein
VIDHHPQGTMDYETAYNLLITEGNALFQSGSEDSFLKRLQQGKPPIPGQITSILLALRIIFEALQEQKTVDRQLALAVYLIALESQRLFQSGRDAGVDWPPLLKEDLYRISLAVKSLFSGVWQT